MANRVTERFLHALSPAGRDEGERSLFHRVANMTSGVLVVDEESDARPLLVACFESRFPVAVNYVRHDPSVPRIETSSEEVVGEPEIRHFLASR